jgi:hypothetical protein
MATYVIRWHVARAGEPAVGGVTVSSSKTQQQLDRVLVQLKEAFPNWVGIEASYTN